MRLISYGRRDNEDLQALRRWLAIGVHELAKAAGAPQV